MTKHRYHAEAEATAALITAAVSAALAVLGLALFWTGGSAGAVLGELLVGWGAAGACVTLFRYRPGLGRGKGQHGTPSGQQRGLGSDHDERRAVSRRLRHRASPGDQPRVLVMLGVGLVFLGAAAALALHQGG